MSVIDAPRIGAVSTDDLRGVIASVLPIVIEDVQSLVESSCLLTCGTDGRFAPILTSLDPESAAMVKARIGHIRTMEQMIGRRMPMEPWLRNIVAHGLPSAVTIAQIIDRVAIASGLDPKRLTSKRKDAEAVWARDLIIKLASEYTRHSMAHIGRELGDRDHSTILAAITRIDQVRRLDGEWVNRLVRLRREIEREITNFSPASKGD